METLEAPLGPLRPEYETIAREVNRIRLMLWAWDAAAARSAVQALEMEFGRSLRIARRVQRDVSEVSRALRGEALAELEGWDLNPSERDFALKLVRNRLARPSPEENPYFVLSGLVVELDRLKKRASEVQAGVQTRRGAPERRADEALVHERSGFHYQAIRYDERQYELRAYRPSPRALSYSRLLDGLLERFPTSERLSEPEAEGALAVRSLADESLLDVAVVGVDRVLVEVTALRPAVDPFPWFRLALDAVADAQE